MTDPRTVLSRLSKKDRQILEETVQRFEENCRLGNRPTLESLLPDSEPLRTVVLTELVHTDLELQLKAGNRVRVEDYLRRFAELRDNGSLLRELMRTEYEFRLTSEPDLKLSEYRRRFPAHPTPVSTGRAIHTHCPDCHSRIDLGHESSYRKIVCPECGNSFSLTSNELTDSPQSEVRSIAHFDLLEELGKGQFGTVWKARDTKLDRIVAVKIPRRGQLDASETEQFFREARAAAQLKHPNIVSVHEVGRANDSIYIVSDCVEGANLREWLVSRRLTPREAAKLCVKVAEALHHAHESGVIHRDLKPANIMLDVDGEPHILDFGIAKRDAGEVTMTIEGNLLGTPAYMSPEQARGKGHEADRRSDVYSLGMIFFELLADERPFRGNTQMLLHQVLFVEPPSPRRFNANIPLDLETICLKCLEKEPSQRYSTTHELAQDLERWLRNEPIIARPIGRFARAWRWCKRNPASAALFVVVALAATVTLSITLAYNARLITALRESKKHQDKAKQNALSEREQKLEARKQLRKAQRTAYALQLQQAAQLATSDPGRGLALLDDSERCPIELRDVTWRLVRHWCSRNEWTFTGHREAVRAFVVSPDSSRIASADDAGVILLWQPGDRTGAKVLDHRNGPVNALAFSPDGRYLVAGGRQKTIDVYDLEDDQATRVLAGHEDDVNSLAFTPDGRSLISASSDHTARIWDFQTGQEQSRLSGHTASVFSVAASPNGQTLATGSKDFTVRLWDLSTGNEMGQLAGHRGWVTAVSFSPDGKRLATSCVDQSIRVFELSNPKTPRLLNGHRGLVSAIAFSADGRTLASASYDGTVRLWDALAGAELTTLRGHRHHVTAVRFHPNGLSLLSAGKDHTIRAWKTGKPDEPDVLKGQDRPITSLSFSSSGTKLASAGYDGTVRLLDLHDRRQHVILGPVAGWIRHVAFDSARRRIIAADSNGLVHVWEIDQPGEAKKINAHDLWVTAFARSPDGRWFATSGAEDKRVRVWNAETFVEVASLTSEESAEFVDLVFDPSGTSLAGADVSGTIHLWSTASWTPIASFGTKGRELSCLAFVTPETLVAGSTDGTATVWNTATGTIKTTLRAYTGAIVSLAISPQQRTIVTAGADGTVRFWDPEIGIQRASLTVSSELSCIQISPDGNMLAAASREGNVRIWNCEKPEAPSAPSTQEQNR